MSTPVRVDAEMLQMLRTLLDLYGCSATARVAEDAFATLQSGRSTATANERWRFGVSELSISYGGQGIPRVRALAEVLNRAPAEHADVTVLQDLGGTLWESLAAGGCHVPDEKLFHDLVAIIYAQTETTSNPRLLRFGVAIEWSADRTPSLKVYFDLFAAGTHDSPTRLEKVFDRLGLRSEWTAFSALAATESADLTCRGIGVDFSPSAGRNLRLYLPGSYWPVGHIRRLIQHSQWPDLEWQLDAFNRDILGGLFDHEAASAMLLGIVYADRLPTPRPVIKLDGSLASHSIDDAAATSAITTLSAAVGVSLPNYREAISFATRGRALADLQRVTQYCSLDLGPKPRVGVYLRPLCCSSKHASPNRVPRLKPALLARLDHSLRRAIEALQRERVSGFSSAAHRMQFPRAAGFDNPTELHEGRIFQIATIGCALALAARSGVEIDRAGIDADIKELARMRFTEARGGWRYFPSLSELPPDADDLAQILQLLILARSDQVDHLCADAADLLLAEQHQDGSFGTWIVDPLLPNGPRSRIENAIATQWGAGADPEVIANVVHALTLWARPEDVEKVRAAATFVASQQQDDGSWISTWYSGPFYGTWVGARAIREVLPQSHTLNLAAQYLVRSQHADGGWGLDGSEPTSTALALAAMVELRHSLADAPELLTRGVEYLVREQGDDGLWRGDALIKMDPSRTWPDMEFRLPPITHGSAALTTAFGLQAACAARSVLSSY